MPAALALFLTLACSNKDGDGECTDVFYADTDGDGHGDAANTATACEVPDGFTSADDDCDDANGAVYPGADEVCDGSDNDCEGTVDEGAIDERTWYTDADGDGFGTGDGTIACVKPEENSVARPNDCDDTDVAINPEAAEACNKVDDDCDELVDGDDDDLVVPDFFLDNDKDGYGDPATAVFACEAPGGYVPGGNDCDDTNPEVHPNTGEHCDGFDNDCDKLVDMDDDPIFGTSTFWVDGDGDGYGDPASTTIVECFAPSGYAADNTDCDDGNAEWHALLDYFRDADGDGWGAGDPHNKCEPGIVGGFIEVPIDGDCDDEDPAINPDAVELCAEVDENCNELEEEADPALVPDVWYVDADGDGWGVATSTIDSCDPTVGYVLLDGDCDDANDYVHPGAAEICDLLDNDCDAVVEDSDAIDWYADVDADGYGNPTDIVNSCAEPSGYVMDGTDCDDAVSTTHPDAAEICANGVDDNCDAVNDNCIFDIGNAGFVFEGDQLGQGLGLTLAIGDFDGDLDEDLLMGSEWAERDRGEVYIVNGPMTGTMSAADATTISPGADLPNYFGAVIAAGDANVDDFDDVLVSPHLGEHSFLFLGPTTGNRTDLDSDLQVRSPTPLDMEIVSDFDDDGVNDFVVVADKAYVMSGALSGGTDTVMDSTYAWDGGMSGGLPVPVQDVEEIDVNGDGLTELAMGATQATEGYVWIVEGGLPAGSYVAQAVAIAAIESSGEFGSCMIAADYDGDGSGDLIVNAPAVQSDDKDHFAATYVFLDSTLEGAAALLTEADADTTIEAFGGTGKQMTAGDFDADGNIDIAMGNPYGEYHQGFVFLHFGPVTGTVEEATLLSIPGIEHEWHGTSLESVADWSGDGGDELVIGAQALGATAIWGANGNGGAYVVFSDEFVP
jgi:hypothetical protein